MTKRIPSLRGVLFDKDGTLIDFHQTWLPVYRRAAAVAARVARCPGVEEELLEATGYDPRTGRCRPSSLLAAGTVEEIAAIWAEKSGASRSALTAEVSAIFDAEAPELAVPVRDLHLVLQRLKERGFLLGVATMDSKASADATLSRIGIGHHFDFVCGYDSGHGQKPGRGMVDAFCAQVGIRPAETVLVGDTLHDLDMGRAAAVGRVVGVLTGSSTRAQLAPHCDEVIAGISELESLLDRWAGRQRMRRNEGTSDK